MAKAVVITNLERSAVELRALVGGFRPGDGQYRSVALHGFA
ncbi:hypothetical protein [Acidocella sp.]|nr:hypothetical protein [Acidocella sp.]